jgi:hypothetical protein
VDLIRMIKQFWEWIYRSNDPSPQDKKKFLKRDKKKYLKRKEYI